MGVGRGAKTLPCKKIVEKPTRNSAGFCGGGQGLSLGCGAKERRRRRISHQLSLSGVYDILSLLKSLTVNMILSFTKCLSIKNH
jgi:hypothetical protein